MSPAEEAAEKVQEFTSSWAAAALHPFGASPSGFLGHRHGQVGAEKERKTCRGWGLQPQAGGWAHRKDPFWDSQKFLGLFGFLILSVRPVEGCLHTVMWSLTESSHQETTEKPKLMDNI